MGKADEVCGGDHRDGDSNGHGGVVDEAAVSPECVYDWDNAGGHGYSE